MRARKQKTKIGWIYKAMIVLNLAVAALLLISYLSSFISPDTIWLLAFIGLGYPFLLLLNVLFAVGWLFKTPKLSLLSIFAILIGYKFLVSTIGFREPTSIHLPKSSTNLIRVMTWNVHQFKRFEDDTNEKTSKDQMLEVIRKEQPDILCIQEFFSRRKGEFNLERAIADILKTKYKYIEEITSNDYELVGTAIFSKFPIKNKGLVTFPDTPLGNEAIFVDVESHNKKFRVYSVHLQSIKFQPEDYEFLKNVKKEIKTDVVSTKRLGSRLKYAFKKRGQQVEFLKEKLNEVKYPVVIAGDFNDTPTSYALNTLVSGMNNSFREKGSGLGITYNGDFPNFQIDYILSGPQFEVKNFIIIDKKLSDHYPLRTDLELK